MWPGVNLALDALAVCSRGENKEGSLLVDIVAAAAHRASRLSTPGRSPKSLGDSDVMQDRRLAARRGIASSPDADPHCAEASVVRLTSAAIGTWIAGLVAAVS